LVELDFLKIPYTIQGMPIARTEAHREERQRSSELSKRALEQIRWFDLELLQVPAFGKVLTQLWLNHSCEDAGLRIVQAKVPDEILFSSNLGDVAVRRRNLWKRNPADILHLGAYPIGTWRSERRLVVSRPEGEETLIELISKVHRDRDGKIDRYQGGNVKVLDDQGQMTPLEEATDRISAILASL
jgi:hypothetical protein